MNVRKKWKQVRTEEKVKKMKEGRNEREREKRKLG